MAGLSTDLVSARASRFTIAFKSATGASSSAIALRKLLRLDIVTEFSL